MDAIHTASQRDRDKFLSGEAKIGLDALHLGGAVQKLRSINPKLLRQFLPTLCQNHQRNFHFSLLLHPL